MAQIRGLEVFGKHFQTYRDQFVLIGGVASWLTMEEAGQYFRATKDIDVVLVIEALNTEFVAAFWDLYGPVDTPSARWAGLKINGLLFTGSRTLTMKPIPSKSNYFHEPPKELSTQEMQR